MPCTICLQVFSADRHPCLLHCGHSFCAPCLEDLHRLNHGVIPCIICGGEEYYQEVGTLPIDLCVEEEESRTVAPSLQKEDSQDAAPPSVPRVIADKGPVTLMGERSTVLGLPADPGTTYTTHLEIRVTKVRVAACRGFFVTYEDNAGRILFWSEWNVWNDRVAMCASNPATGREMEIPPKRRCGLRWGALHRVTIIEDQARYKVLLDGNTVGQITKTGHPSAATRIKVQSWYATTLKISKFLVETK